MIITATELKKDLGKYLKKAATEDIYITRNGKITTKLSPPFQERVDTAKSLFGAVPETTTLDDARYEALSQE